jgi:hypothetical protein
MRSLLVELMFVVVFGLPLAAIGETLRFQADDWVAECGALQQGADADCSILALLTTRVAMVPKGRFRCWSTCGMAL